MPESFNLVGFVLVMAGWIFSLCLHEFSHALVAYYGGDTSVRDKGYLTFNPLRYTDPVQSLLWPLVFLLMGGIGLPGGAVYINRSRLRGPGWDCAVSMAGPLANVALLLVLMVPFWLGLAPVEHASVTWQAYAYVCRLQVMAVVFNLLPVPPLDGFGAVSAFMEPLARARIYAMSRFTFLILLVVMMNTPVGGMFWRTIQGYCLALGVPTELAEAGQGMMQLW